MEISNLSDAEFKTLLLRCLRNSLGTSTAKKDPGRNEGHTKCEIKKNLQGINSGVDEAKNPINDLGHKEDKNSQSE